jgi:ribosomal protein S18 acetylase RimI-like enzyme
LAFSSKSGPKSNERGAVKASTEGARHAAFTVRPARAADEQGIHRCLLVAFDPYREQYTPGAFADTVPELEGVRGRLAEMTVLVAEAPGGEIVGTLSFDRPSEGEGHLRGMAVLPEFQGKGIATSMLEAAQLVLRRSGCVRVSLETTVPLQRAIRFYEKNGFLPSGETWDFFGMPLREYVKEFTPE